jgi:hypothetical protein
MLEIKIQVAKRKPARLRSKGLALDFHLSTKVSFFSYFQPTYNQEPIGLIICHGLWGTRV